MKIAVEMCADDQTMRDILFLEATCFPLGAQYDDAEIYYRRCLENPDCINVVARNSENRVVGYGLLVPQPIEVVELLADDPLLIEDYSCMYVDTMAITSKLYASLLGGKVFVRMLDAGVEETIRRGYLRFCTHARKKTGLNRSIRKYFGNRIITTRDIAKWRWVVDEPYEYIEGWLEERHAAGKEP